MYVYEYVISNNVTVFTTQEIQGSVLERIIAGLKQGDVIGALKKNDVPWLVAAITTTGGTTYIPNRDYMLKELALNPKSEELIELAKEFMFTLDYDSIKDDIKYLYLRVAKVREVLNKMVEFVELACHEKHQQGGE